MTLDDTISHYSGFVQVLERNDRLGWIRVRLGKLKTILTFWILPLGDGVYDCFQSHYIHTDMQPMPAFRSSHTSFSGKGETLKRAIFNILLEYNWAVKNGHSPKKRWLRPSDEARRVFGG
jgi:hypothetical protein